MTEVATERLWFDADKTKLVTDGDPDAKSLAAAPGDEIPDGFKVPSGAKTSAAKAEADAAKAAAKAEADAAKAAKKAEADAAKAAAKAENKAGSTPANKSGVSVTKEP